jgi:hypothetical protein
MPIKQKGYSHNKADARHRQKRTEAEARNKLWAQLSRNEQLRLLAQRRGECKRQITRIKNFNTNR